jgi:ribosomal protein L11 methyltransferase
MYLWRKRARPEWWIDNEQLLRARFGHQIAIIETPNRKRIEIQIACASPNELKKFGGSARKLPRDWLKRFARLAKTKPIRIKDRQLLIPAGAAFGTGEHATTAMCLTMLKRAARAEDVVVDLGTGSGILALAARLLGAKRVLAVDNDPVAIRVAKQNARRNKIDNVEFKVADARKLKFPDKIDIVVANLFSELLVAILPKVARAHSLILSGFLREQESAVLRAVKRCKIDIVNVRRRGKWIAIFARELRRS